MECKIYVSFPSSSTSLAKLISSDKAIKAYLRVSGDELYFSVPARSLSDNLTVKIPVKAVLEALSLELPSWAVLTKIKHKNVQVKVEVPAPFPTLDIDRLRRTPCRQCTKDLEDAKSVTLTSDGVFCNDDCYDTWKRLSALPRTGQEE